MRTLEPYFGWNLSTTCRVAAEKAKLVKDDVRFVFNTIEVIAHPGDTLEELQEQWRNSCQTAREAYLNSEEYKTSQRREAEELERKQSAVLVESAQTQQEMHDASDPQPHTEKQLLEYIQSLVHRLHDYDTCVYSMSLAATAAFNYVAETLGTSGFQASCADLDFIRRSRSIKGPILLIKIEDALYPQCDPFAKLTDAIDSSHEWLKTEARKLLAGSSHVHPDVLEHWKMLAEVPNEE